MPNTESLVINYQGKEIPYQMPLGICLDGEITKKIHDYIFPKYHEIVPEALIMLNDTGIQTVRNDAIRQLNEDYIRNEPLLKKALENTVNLTTQLLD